MGMDTRIFEREETPPVADLHVVFGRDGRVSVLGRDVGRWRNPDPSGAPHARTPVYCFVAHDGEVENARVRNWLANAGRSAFYRLSTKARDQGAQAGRTPGVAVIENPYKHGSLDSDIWLNSYWRARNLREQSTGKR
jgi:hypothetical protein